MEPRRTLNDCLSITNEQLMAVNDQMISEAERACPKVLRAPPLLIGVAGGTASGKTTVCHKIKESLADDRVAIISMDNFYRALTPEEHDNVGGAFWSYLLSRDVLQQAPACA